MQRNMYIIGRDEVGRPRSGRTSPRSYKYIIGIDEAGRGPLAGPVVVGGIKLKARSQKLKIFTGIRDSKKLTPKKREEWFRVLTSHPSIEWAVARITPRTIDRINIARAANLGAEKVHQKLCSKLSVGAHRTLLDGGLVLPRDILHETIVKGDEKIPAIAAASIIAKVTRDRIMLRLHKKYPQYRFDLHKGYATRLHRQLLGEFGQCEIHRSSFICKNVGRLVP